LSVRSKRQALAFESEKGIAKKQWCCARSIQTRWAQSWCTCVH